VAIANGGGQIGYYRSAALICKQTFKIYSTTRTGAGCVCAAHSYAETQIRCAALLKQRIVSADRFKIIVWQTIEKPY